ncbi:hypothetical protein [Kitasatospora sp. NPDC059571]|uniref:hypothetical protein n=1 Tax=Kitasatospora sp. NPDC059571 TaxID=3346871 RepID=UPI0036ABC86C
MARLTNQERIAQLEERVIELEDVVLYLAQALGQHQALTEAETEAVRQTYHRALRLRPGIR